MFNKIFSQAIVIVNVFVCIAIMLMDAPPLG